MLVLVVSNNVAEIYLILGIPMHAEVVFFLYCSNDSFVIVVKRF